MKLSIIIPVYNEGKTLRQLLIKLNVSMYLTAEKKVALWSKNNFWHVEETIEQVYDKLGLEYKHKKEEVN